MADYKKAKELALACWSEVDYCTEYEDAFVFSSWYDDELCDADCL